MVNNDFASNQSPNYTRRLIKIIMEHYGQTPSFTAYYNHTMIREIEWKCNDKRKSMSEL